jgi:hypothetical protein
VKGLGEEVDLTTPRPGEVLYSVPFGRLRFFGRAVFGTVFAVVAGFVVGGLAWVLAGCFVGFVWLWTIGLMSFEANVDSDGNLEFRGFVRRQRTTAEAVRKITLRKNIREGGDGRVLFRFDDFRIARMPWAILNTGLIQRIRELNPSVELSGWS